ALVTSFFLADGAVGPYLYGTIWHNLVPDVGRWGHAPSEWRGFPLLVGLALVAAVTVWRFTPQAGIASRRGFLLLAAAIYGAGLVTLWPLRTRQDLLPLEPLAILAVVPLLRAAGDRLGRAAGIPRAMLPAAVTLAALAFVVHDARPWRDDTRPERAFLSDVLRLTEPGETVLDLKGDAIFRARPYYYALEGLTKARIAL